MAERRRRPRHVGAWAGVALATASVLLGVGRPPTPSFAAQEDGRVLASPVRLRAGSGATLRLDDGARYHGVLELAADGRVVNEVGFETYVTGVAEMPSRWPIEALRAQAVAARTYAWWSMRHAAGDDTDICATTACQRYGGAEVVLDGGQRWARAVQDTRGEVLVDGQGEPALARYFSTSGGRTFANEDVFPSSGPRPYLVGIEDPEDGISPYHRWTVSLTRAELDAILGRGERLSAAVPLASLERLGPVDDPSARIRATGEDGTVVEVGAGELRDLISLVAPELFEDRFPPPRADGLRALPTTVPTARFSIESDGRRVVLHGRGWGHGVGMGQYGARGRARDGAGYREILAAYYGGLEPTVAPGLPERIRVDLGVREVSSVVGSASFSIEDADGVVVDRALGRWGARRVGSGWRLTPPAGTDRPLTVSPTRQVGVGVDGAITVEAEVNKPVELRLEVRDAQGRLVLERERGLAEAGSHAATWRPADARGAPVEPGRYQVALLAEDAAGTVGGTPRTVLVERSAGSEPDAVLWTVAAAVVALPVALLVLATTRRERT